MTHPIDATAFWAAATAVYLLAGVIKGVVGLGLPTVLALWRERAAEVSGRALPCGHYVPEEAPDELLAEALAFFSLLLPPSQHAPAGDTP